MQEKPNQVKLSRRKFLWTVAATGLSVGAVPLLASCAPATGPAAPASQAGEAAAPGEEAITLTLNMRAGGDQSEPAIYVRRPAKFMEENPNIKIELVPIPGEEYDAKILTSASAGTVADCLFTSDVWTLTLASPNWVSLQRWMTSLKRMASRRMSGYPLPSIH